MGLLDFLRKRRDSKRIGLSSVPTMGGYTPTITDFGEDAYESDIIVQAIRCKATEMKKLQPRHVRRSAGAIETVTDSSVARLLRRPNPYMTMADLLEKATILLELNKNAFIYPTYYVTKSGERYYTGLWPLKPTDVDKMEDAKGEIFFRFRFGNGTTVDLPDKDVIHWRKDFGVDDWFGGSIERGSGDRALLRLVRQYDRLTQSIAEALNVSTKVNGIVKTNTYLSDEATQRAQAEFNDRLMANESGILFMDLKSEYVNIPRDIKMVDKDTIEFFYKQILRNTGVSLAILDGDYTKAQKEAFYEHALEGDIKSLGEAMTRVLFTEREEAFGNAVQLYPNSIVFMSMENKLSALQIGLPAGIFTKDEARELLGYPPMPDGQGQVVAQGYNSLLDKNNVNTLAEEGQAPTPPQEGGEADAGQQGA